MAPLTLHFLGVVAFPLDVVDVVDDRLSMKLLSERFRRVAVVGARRQHVGAAGALCCEELEAVEAALRRGEMRCNQTVGASPKRVR